MDPKVLIIVAALSGGYFVEHTYIKPAAHAVVHVAKAAGVKVGHGLKHLIGK